MARDIALAGGTGQTVQAEAARRLAAAIKPGDDLTVHIYHLAVCVDALTRARCRESPASPRRHGRAAWRSCAVAWVCRSCHPCLSQRTNCSALRSVPDCPAASAPADT